jgi:hypothetical protein
MLEQFLESNKYSKCYLNIITKARKRIAKNKEYVEIHHILPKSIYPEYKNLKKHPWNGVELSAREHFICHWLLTKIFTEKRKIKQMHKAFAGLSMSNDVQKRNLTSKQYEIIRKSISEAQKGKIPWNKNKKIGSPSDESNLKRSESMKQHWSEHAHPRKGKPSWLAGRAGTNPYTKERCNQQKELMRKLFQENPDRAANMSAETFYFLFKEEPLQIHNLKKYCRDNKLNYTLMLAAINKNIEYEGYCRNNSKYSIKIPFSTREDKLQCPHCGHKGKKIAAMKRWHFNNCKSYST